MSHHQTNLETDASQSRKCTVTKEAPSTHGSVMKKYLPFKFPRKGTLNHLVFNHVFSSRCFYHITIVPIRKKERKEGNPNRQTKSNKIKENQNQTNNIISKAHRNTWSPFVLANCSWVWALPWKVESLKSLPLVRSIPTMTAGRMKDPKQTPRLKHCCHRLESSTLGTTPEILFTLSVS